MKKIITCIVILLFCLQLITSADTNYTQAERRIKSVQNQDENIDVNAFENNYQNMVNKTVSQNSLSVIEKLFNGKDSYASGTIFKQIGYDLFSPSSQSSSSSAGKYGSSYKLSIGEKVNINSYGESLDVMAMTGANLLAPVVKTEVDSKGNIFVQGVGMFPAENRSVQEVENAINSVAASKYKNLKVRLTVASGQDMSVFVYGQVNRPGRVLVGNNSSVFDALNAAGGVKKTGTLRNISYSSQGKKSTIDLYQTFFTSSSTLPIVHPNDTIFVDKIGNVLAIKNGVNVVGIYEVKSGENLETMIKYAGGFLPATQVSDVTLTSFDTKLNQRTAKTVQWSNAKNTQIKNGDSVEFRELYNSAENIVVLQGNVKHPSTYAYKPGMRLSDILKSEDELLEETFINQAVIRRISGKDNSVETIPVYLKEFFSGMNDPLLKPRDIINVYKNTNSQFVDIYGCINIPKHLTYTTNMTLNDVMTDIQFMESDVKTVDDDQSNEKNLSYKNEILKDTSVQLNATTENSNQLIPTENVAVEIINDNGTQLYYLYDIMINSDRIKSIKLNPDDKVFFRTLRNNEIMKTVKISGFVKKPGVYSFVEGKKLTDMIKMAGGLTHDAELKGIVYKRTNLKHKQTELAYKNNQRDIKLIEGRIASGYKQSVNDQQAKLDMIEMLKDDGDLINNKYSGQISLDIKSNDLSKISNHYNIDVQDGDDIYIPRIATHVSVIGEVYNEQSFIYKNGSNAKYYIKQVGGYTPNANKFRIYKIGVNGKAEKISNGSKIAAGDTIVVPRRIAGNDYLTPICDTLRGIASLFVSIFAISRW